MAGLQLCFNFEDVTLTAGAWKTLGSVKAGTDQHVKIDRVRLATSGVAGDALPLWFRLQPITAGTGTGTTITPSKRNRAFATTSRSVVRTNFTVEPTAIANSVLCEDQFHPQGGESQDFSFEDILTEAAGEVAIQVFTVAAQAAVKSAGHCFFTE